VDCIDNLQLIDSLNRAELAALLAKTSALHSAIIARLLSDAATSDGDRLLTVEQAADVLGVGKGWLYRRVGKLGLARKLSDNTLRISQNALQSYIKSSARRGGK
jgi:hypothetical protein